MMLFKNRIATASGILCNIIYELHNDAILYLFLSPEHGDIGLCVLDLDFHQMRQMEWQ